MMESEQEPKPKIVPGVVYLSSIPPFMNVTKVRELLSKFGEVRRIYLQPGKGAKPGKPSKHFTEGWVEFANKKVAKRTARILNGTQVGGKRRTPYYESLWNIKYLSKFRWAHLSERTAFEKARREQRMRAEIAQAKREANYYKDIYQKNKYSRRQKGNKKSEENSQQLADGESANVLASSSGKTDKDNTSETVEMKPLQNNKSIDLFKQLFMESSES